MIPLIKNYKNPDYLSSHLKSILDKYINSEIDIKSCPHCNSSKIIKHGKSSTGQRYLCKCCSHTFSPRTNRTMFRSRISAKKWEEYLKLMLTGATLKVCAYKVGINIKTAFYWRHKILDAIALTHGNTKLQDTVSMVNLSTLESYKGEKNHIFTEPRFQIYNLLALDSKDSVGAESISRGMWDYNSFYKKVYPRIDLKAKLVSYQSHKIRAICDKHNGEPLCRYLSCEGTPIDNYRKVCQIFLAKFRGVATKYLKNYLYYFALFILEKPFDSINLLYSLSKVLINRCKC